MKKYTKPEIEISVFATEDIITASETDSTSNYMLTKTNPGDNSTNGVDGIDYNSMQYGQ